MNARREARERNRVSIVWVYQDVVERKKIWVIVKSLKVGRAGIEVSKEGGLS